MLDTMDDLDLLLELTFGIAAVEPCFQPQLVLTLENPFCIGKLLLVLCQEKVQIKHAFFKVGLPCQSFCFFV